MLTCGTDTVWNVFLIRPTHCIILYTHPMFVPTEWKCWDSWDIFCWNLWISFDVLSLFHTYIHTQIRINTHPLTETHIPTHWNTQTLSFNANTTRPTQTSSILNWRVCYSRDSTSFHSTMFPIYFYLLNAFPWSLELYTSLFPPIPTGIIPSVSTSKTKTGKTGAVCLLTLIGYLKEFTVE